MKFNATLHSDARAFQNPRDWEQRGQSESSEDDETFTILCHTRGSAFVVYRHSDGRCVEVNAWALFALGEALVRTALPAGPIVITGTARVDTDHPSLPSASVAGGGA